MYEFRTDPVEAIQALLAAVDAFEADGSISNGTGESLRAFLAQAEAAISKGDNDAANWSLTRFIDHGGRQTPRHITESAARSLIGMATASRVGSRRDIAVITPGDEIRSVAENRQNQGSPDLRWPVAAIA